MFSFKVIIPDVLYSNEHLQHCVCVCTAMLLNADQMLVTPHLVNTMDNKLEPEQNNLQCSYVPTHACAHAYTIPTPY